MIKTQPTFALMPHIKRFGLPAITAWLLHLCIFSTLLLITGNIMDVFTGETTQYDAVFIVLPLILGLLLGLWLVKKRGKHLRKKL